jgi:hypothetical protein
MRPYKAIVWVADPTEPGERVELLAESGDAAMALLLETFGPHAKISLRNDEDANRVR